MGVHLYLPGELGDRAYTAHSASLAVTDDIDVRMRVRVADLSDALIYPLTRWEDVGEDSWFVAVTATGEMRLAWNDSGFMMETSSAALPGSYDDEWIDLRWTLDVDVGGTDAEAKFFYKDTSVALNSDSGWAQLGSTQSVGSTTQIDNPTSLALTLGYTTTSGAGAWEGSCRRAIVYDGIGSSSGVLWDANFENEIPGTTSFTEDGDSGLTVNIEQTGDPQAEILSITPPALRGALIRSKKLYTSVRM